MGIAGMTKMGIKRRLLIQNVSLITLTILLFLGILVSGIYSYYYIGTIDMLKNHAVNSSQFANKYMNLHSFTLRNELTNLQKNFSIPQAETQILNARGDLLSSSSGFIPDEKPDFKDIEEAFRNGSGTWIGNHPITGEHILAVSVPLNGENNTIGLIRFITSLESLDNNFRTILLSLFLIGLVILLIVFMVSTLFARNLTKPVIELTEASQKLAKGELETRIVGQYKDEFQTLSTSFNDMARELLKTEKMKNEFISSVSHEIRTPLTSIKGWSETLLTGDLQNVQENKTGLTIISKETNRLIGLVEDLLDFSRFSNGSFTIHPTTFSFIRTLNEVILQLNQKRKEKGISIMLESDETVDLFADENRIRQVLINLLDNAIKYSDPNSTVFIRYIQTNSHFTFEIEDEGQGIDPEHLQHIATLFYKERENSDGVGLGLAICKNIVELHHGKFFVKSDKGSGTTAGFTIPLRS
ncbi:cell wall metabolism sensor histidine kinase WalK [uncultured Rossellomorea sp.]|uniref:sensor histidine kinase n=2 Tax=Rossellomorea TaxID=2837508 RepID=UPI0026057E79|nr:HAMP domain-containing sensor histidine kinase [uncultured Rossellomorea sp.]